MIAADKPALTQLLGASNRELGAVWWSCLVWANAEPDIVTTAAPAAIKSLRFVWDLLTLVVAISNLVAN